MEDRSIPVPFASVFRDVILEFVGNRGVRYGNRR